MKSSTKILLILLLTLTVVCAIGSSLHVQENFWEEQAVKQRLGKMPEMQVPKSTNSSSTQETMPEQPKPLTGVEKPTTATEVPKEPLRKEPMPATVQYEDAEVEAFNGDAYSSAQF